MLRPQVAPWILVGDTIIDRPSPYGAGLRQGTLFHDSATGDCSVLVIYPETGIHAWEGFCTGASGSSGAGGGALLKWHGGNTSGTVIVGNNYYLADDPALVRIVGSAFSPAYPVATTRTPSNLAVNIGNNTGGEIEVGLSINRAAPAAGATVTLITGIASAPGPLPEIAPGDTVDIVFTAVGTNNSTSFAISATLEL